MEKITRPRGYGVILGSSIAANARVAWLDRATQSYLVVNREANPIKALLGLNADSDLFATSTNLILDNAITHQGM